jgi:predicted DNA-binding transcriptional regulator YafY
MRADRLVATLLVLQRRGSVTARELADELETSVSTARRDLDALSAAGLPVYAERGRGGGWRLLGGARTDLSGLTAPETLALFTLLGPAAAASPDARAALRKLTRALPAPFRDAAERAAAAVAVDPAGWGRAPVHAPDALPVLQEAIAARRLVRFRYAGATRRGDHADDPAAGTRLREASPWGLVDKAGVWYLVAGTTRGRRTFRVDRMTAVDAGADGSAEVPGDLDLAGEWDRVVTEVEQRRGAVSARVQAPRALVGPLRAALGARHVTTVPAPDGDAGPDDAPTVPLDVTADTADMLARQLAGWVPDVEVLGPPEVRAALVARGAAIVAACRDEAGA